MDATGESPRQRWFREHFEDTVYAINDFLEGDGISLTDKRVVDVGCGDGIIDLGLALKTAPDRLVGVDINAVDIDGLLGEARAFADVREMPPNLEFRQSGPATIPASDGEFDLAITWSAFEHVLDPIALLTDLRRVLKPGATLMVQIWPMFHSKWGDHLWDWFPEGWVSYLHDDETVARTLRADTETDPDWLETKINDYLTLNRITVDELQRCLLMAGFVPTKFQLMSETVHIPPALNRHPISLLATSGIKLLAHVPV